MILMHNIYPCIQFNRLVHRRLLHLRSQSQAASVVSVAGTRVSSLLYISLSVCLSHSASVVSVAGTRVSSL